MQSLQTDWVLGDSGKGDVETLTLSSCAPVPNHSRVGDVVASGTCRDRCEARRQSPPCGGLRGLSCVVHIEPLSEAAVLSEATDKERDSLVGILVKRFGLPLDTQQH